ncbi:uncharacterized protein LOC110109680 [Dendrobium catenatum]|uniref:Protein ARABIDILLO 1 n=1 Tax=Dendrobium catenatum TaxID=906689 RepID=A0A2I0WUN9_9ASPA|nr:uncharacterized protein LOC110109680 [Dendrobium catenatum]PKU79367.1 Protein ARABIDILLO 1 [Dendrobium catenatum]
MMMNGRHGGGTIVAASAVVGGVVAAVGGGKNIEEELSLPILLAERVRKAATEAESFKTECAEVGKQVDQLATMLRSAVRRATASPSVYDRPVRRIVAEAAKTLERALALVRRCKRAGVLRRVVTITTGSTDFRKIVPLLDASIGDLRWLLSVYSDDAAGGGIVLSLPPIASTDPILSWVWSYIVTVQMASSTSDRVEAAHTLANLALDNNRNKKIIIEEGGVPPLLSLLRDGPSVDAQVAAAAALSNLATDPDHVALIIKELAVPIIVHVLSDSPMRLQTRVASLVSRMAYHLPVIAQEEFARENAVRPLVSLLSFEVPLDEPRPSASIHSLVQGMANLQYLNSAVIATSGSGGSGSSRGKNSRDYYNHNRKERESESSEVKQALKIACAEALWKLSSGSVSNSRKITETKGLLCLSKLIERERGELQHNCLMTVMEIAVAAESDADLRRSAFKTKYPAAKSVVDQLLKVAQQGSSPALEIAAIKAIGSLARAFSASETRVLQPLVLQLGHWNPDVAAEAATALRKFSCPENYNSVHNSKAIIEFAGVPQLMRLLRTGEKTQLPGLILLCYLALHAAGSDALERVKALGALESVSRTAIAQHPSIKDLLPKAIYHLELYRVGSHIHRDQYPM